MAQYLKKKTFIKVMRGYSPEEVDAYIDYLVTKYNEISRENEENKRKISVALRKLQEMSEKTGAVPGKTGDPAKVAEGEQIIAAARAEERKILEEAAKNAQAMLKDAEKAALEKAREITAQAEAASAESETYAKAQYETAQKLYSEVFTFRDRLFTMYSDHIEMLENIAGEANEYYDRVADAGGGLQVEKTAEKEPIAADKAPGREPEETDGYDEAVYDEPMAPAFPAEEEPLTEDEPAGEPDEALKDIIPSDLLSDFPEDLPGGENNEEMAKYLSFMGDGAEFDDLSDLDGEELLRIDWKNRKPKQQPVVLSSFAYDAEAEEDDEWDLPQPTRRGQSAESDFHDFDDLLNKGGKSDNDFSTTDEFDIVYSTRNSRKNVEEIVKQPLVAPEKPSNPKKHRRF